MNYRQWKKNYKKQHGYNPPIEDDKRKLRKAAVKTIKTISIDELANTIRFAAASLFDALSNAFNAASESAQSLAKRLRTEQTEDNTAALIEEGEHEEAIATAGYTEKGGIQQ